MTLIERMMVLTRVLQKIMTESASQHDLRKGSVNYLARQVFLQHLWDGLLQHLLASKLRKDKTR